MLSKLPTGMINMHTKYQVDICNGKVLFCRIRKMSFKDASLVEYSIVRSMYIEVLALFRRIVILIAKSCCGSLMVPNSSKLILFPKSQCPVLTSQ